MISLDWLAKLLIRVQSPWKQGGSPSVSEAAFDEPNQITSTADCISRKVRNLRNDVRLATWHRYPPSTSTRHRGCPVAPTKKQKNKKKHDLTARIGASIEVLGEKISAL